MTPAQRKSIVSLLDGFREALGELDEDTRAEIVRALFDAATAERMRAVAKPLDHEQLEGLAEAAFQAWLAGERTMEPTWQQVVRAVIFALGLKSLLPPETATGVSAPRPEQLAGETP